MGPRDGAGRGRNPPAQGRILVFLRCLCFPGPRPLAAPRRPTARECSSLIVQNTLILAASLDGARPKGRASERDQLTLVTSACPTPLTRPRRPSLSAQPWEDRSQPPGPRGLFSSLSLELLDNRMFGGMGTAEPAALGAGGSPASAHGLGLHGSPPARPRLLQQEHHTWTAYALDPLSALHCHRPTWKIEKRNTAPALGERSPGLSARRHAEHRCV